MIKSAIFEPNISNMSPKSILLLVSFFLLGVLANAQYTEKINSNRPGTSQGAFSVGNNVLQLETGFGFGKEKHKILDTKTNAFNFDYSVRYGLLIEQLEIRLNGRYRADGVTQTIGANEQKINRSNFVINTIGAKYLIYDPYKKPKENDSLNYEKLKSWKEHYKFRWKTLIPAVSAYAGVNFIASDNPFTFPGDAAISPKFVIAAQNNWTTNYGGDWAFVTNIIIDKVTTDNPAFGLILTATHTINETWAGFVEYEVQKSDFYSDNIMRLGGAYLFDQDLQFDANIAFNFKDTPSIFTCSFGASYRFDWHTKDEIIEQPGLEGGVKEDEEEDLDGEEGLEGELEEGEEENDSIKPRKTSFINDFEEDSFRDEMEQDLDQRRTEERLERERIEQEKIDKKQGKKFKKEEARRLKREAKEARAAEKAALKAEKEKAKMIEDIDAELDKMEEDKGVDQELEDLDKQLRELEKMENDLKAEEQKEKKAEAKEEKKAEEVDVDAEYDKYQKEQEKKKKDEEKRRKKEDKKRLKEEKKRKKEENKRKAQAKKEKKKDQESNDSEIDKELEKFDL